MPSALIRSFIAIAIPETGSAAVTQAINDLRGAGDVRWVTPHQYHLTLKFLGDATPEKLAEIAAQLERIAKNRLRFVVELKGIGAFPRVEKPRVVWMGVAAGERELVSLAGEVEDGCASVGCEREGRAYRPHLTLGRVRSPRDLAGLAARLRDAEEGAGVRFPVEELLLMESDLRPTGAVYTARGRFALRRQESGGGSGI